MLEIGSLVDGKYKILSIIGHGGMSVVYLAINEKANKTWAIKEVRKDGQMDSSIVRQGLVTEIETLKKLKHPKLPSIIDVIEDDDSYIIVMDYIEGRSMDKILEKQGAQPEAFVIEWAKQLCDVLGYLHSRVPPIIYRDMKPANIMLRPDGDVTLIDFGTAKRYEIEIGATTGLGTIGYAAPEQYINSGLGRTDARTDIYCLGISLYHMLTNIDPQKNLVSNKSIRAVNPAFSRGLDAIIIKCTRTQPDNRYQSCAELMYDLENPDKIDKGHRKKARLRLAAFSTTALLSAAFVASGLTLNYKAREQATNTYDYKYNQAQSSSDPDAKVALYNECIAIPGQAGKKDAYLALIDTYKNYDCETLHGAEHTGGAQSFSKAEAAKLEALFMNNEAVLLENPAGYVQICSEIGKMFWYYYSDENQLTRATLSIVWFQKVTATIEANNLRDTETTMRDGSPLRMNDLYTMARVYANIGVFYRDITTDIAEANDKQKYQALFENLSELMNEVAGNENEAEIVRLELLEMARSAMHQYATKFKNDGVTEDDMQALYGQIETILNGMDASTERTIAIWQNTRQQMEATETAITAAYGTTKEDM